MSSIDQLALDIPVSHEERGELAVRWLEEHGKHTLYCGWDHSVGRYDKRLGCTCGLENIVDD